MTTAAPTAAQSRASRNRARLLRTMSGMYDQAARAATSL